jgi:hypothetical protein
MNCERVQSSLSVYCDGYSPKRERQNIWLHLAGCPDCSLRLEQLLATKAALKGLPRRSPPPELSTSLRVLASRELANGASRTVWGAFLTRHTLRLRLWADAIMRPVALPFAGGFVSAVVLFAILVPTFLFRHNSIIRDVPINVLFAEATLKETSPFTLSGDSIVLDVLLDRQGRVIGYSSPSGEGWINDPETRRGVDNLLLFTTFKPGTVHSSRDWEPDDFRYTETSRFGQPVAGKVRIVIQRSAIDVTG